MKAFRIVLLLATIITIFYTILLATEDNEVNENFNLEIIPINRTDGTVDFHVRTVGYGGAYAPAHCLAIWVCDENDNFVRTLVRRAWSYMQHLMKWNEMTNGDYTNAIITGASPTVHTTWTINWDCLDRYGEMIPDGNYRVYVEFTEDNSALIPVNGPWTMVEFTKGNLPQIITPAGNQFFQDLYLEYNLSGPPITSVEITSPSEGDEISQLPFAVFFELDFFSPDSGSINLFINDDFVLQHAGETGIPIYALPEGNVELAIRLFDNQGMPFDPPAEDSINIIYNPVSYSQENINSAITKLDNYPNPFNPDTNIRYSLEAASNVIIEIYNLKGQKIKQLINDLIPVGQHSIVWDGTDKANIPVSSGVYFYRIKTDFGEDKKKCILLK